MTQPDPHYCDHPPDARSRTGCPNWPACAALNPERAAHLRRSLGQDLATLGGWAVGAAIFLVVVVLILRVWP